MLGCELVEKINEYCSIKHSFKGVYSINTLPKYFKKREFLFCNEDLSQNPGTHWLCFLKINQNSFECFDSLGVNENKINLFKKYLKFQKKFSLKFNETKFQHDESNNCGLFVLYFAINRMHNLDLSFKEFLTEYFSDDYFENEKKLKDFFS